MSILWVITINSILYYLKISHHVSCVNNIFICILFGKRYFQCVAVTVVVSNFMPPIDTFDFSYISLPTIYVCLDRIFLFFEILFLTQYLCSIIILSTDRQTNYCKYFYVLTLGTIVLDSAII